MTWRALPIRPYQAAVALMRGVKKLMDPHGILNPYKAGGVQVETPGVSARQTQNIRQLFSSAVGWCKLKPVLKAPGLSA